MRWLLLFAVACAPVRKPLGELAVKPLHELYPSMAVVHEAVFRVENGRLVGAGANAGSDFDLVAMDDGCVRGEILEKHVHICPAPSLPADAKGVYRWQNVGSDLLGYSTQLLEMGDVLRVEANLINYELPVPAGKIGDEIRRHPELVGAACAYGLLPASADSKELWKYEARKR